MAPSLLPRKDHDVLLERIAATILTLGLTTPTPPPPRDLDRQAAVEWIGVALERADPWNSQVALPPPPPPADDLGCPYADLIRTNFDAAGFDGQYMVAIAMRESRCQPDATGHNTNGTVDRGLLQYNSGNMAPGCDLYDPACNVAASVRLARWWAVRGYSWCRPWYCA